MKPPNGEALTAATNQIADLETRKRMCVAELQAVLEKYGMVCLGKETRINGNLVAFELMVQPAQAPGAQAQQGSRIAVPR